MRKVRRSPAPLPGPWRDSGSFSWLQLGSLKASGGLLLLAMLLKELVIKRIKSLVGLIAAAIRHAIEDVLAQATESVVAKSRRLTQGRFAHESEVAAPNLRSPVHILVRYAVPSLGLAAEHENRSQCLIAISDHEALNSYPGRCQTSICPCWQCCP